MWMSKSLFFSVLRIPPNSLSISSDRRGYSAVSSIGSRVLMLSMYPITIGTPPCSSFIFNFFLICEKSFFEEVGVDLSCDVTKDNSCKTGESGQP